MSTMSMTTMSMSGRDGTEGKGTIGMETETIDERRYSKMRVPRGPKKGIRYYKMLGMRHEAGQEMGYEC